MRKVWLLSAVIIVGSVIVLLAIGGGGCNVTVISPSDGATWLVGQTYQVVWSASIDCPYTFDHVDLVGQTAGVADTVLDTLYNVGVEQGSFDYTPGASLLGFDAYMFNFYADSGGQYSAPGPRVATLVGSSGAFHIVTSQPPLETDPKSLSFVLGQARESQSKTFYVLSNEGTIAWEALADQTWMSVQPVTGSSTENATPTPVTLTVDSEGLGEGTYTGTVAINPYETTGEAAVLCVALTISASGSGTADIEVSPKRVKFLSKVGDTAEPQSVVLTNNGSGTATWMATTPSRWLEISPSQGSLGPGAERIITLTPSGDFQRVGSHRTFIHFIAQGDSEAWALAVWTLRPGAVTGVWESSSQRTLTLPIVATGLGGADGSFWSSDLHAMFLGNGSRAAEIKVEGMNNLRILDPLLPGGAAAIQKARSRFKEQSTAASDRGVSNQFTWGATARKMRGIDASIIQFDMDEMGSTMMLDVLGDYFEQEPSSGFIQVRGADVDKLLLMSRTFTTDAEGRTFGQSIMPPDPDEITMRGEGPSYVLGLNNTENWRSNIFITEIAGGTPDVTVQLYDETGQPTGNTLSMTMNPFSQWQLTNVFYRAGSSAERGYAVVTSSGSGAVTVLGSVIDRRTNDPTTIPGMVPAAAREGEGNLYLPAAVHAPGAHNTEWRSDLTLLNTTGQSVDLTLTYVPQQGVDAGPQQKQITLPGKTMGIYEDVVLSLFGIDLGNGTIVITGADAGGIYAFNRIYNLLEDGSTYGQGSMAYKGADAVGSGNGTLFIMGFEQSPKFRSNLGLFEVGGGDADVLVTVVPPMDDPRSLMVHVTAGQLLQLNSLIYAQAGFSETQSDVYVYVDVINGSGKIAAYGSIVDNDSSDATFLKAMKR